MAYKQTAAIAGASNQIGYYLLPRAIATGYSVTAISRYNKTPDNISIHWVRADLNALPQTFTLLDEILFHLGPLTLFKPLAAKMPALNRVIAFSSTSRLTKEASADFYERKVAQTLAQAEDDFIAQCEQRNIVWTLCRPTLIYGCGLDRNITFIARFIRRFGFFPIGGAGCGLRQPVHADDLALACLQILNCSITSKRIYNLSGGETLEYQEMVKYVFDMLDITPRLIHSPLPLLKLALRILRCAPPLRHLSPEMFTRMNYNLCFDYNDAAKDFGYQPRPFRRTDPGLKEF